MKITVPHLHVTLCDWHCHDMLAFCTTARGPSQTIFVALTFSSGIPILLPIAAFSLWVGHWIDKWTLFRLYQKPAHLDDSLARLSAQLLPWALLAHLVVGIWMYGNAEVLKSGTWAGADDDTYAEWKASIEEWDRISLVPKLVRANVLPLLLMAIPTAVFVFSGHVGRQIFVKILQIVSCGRFGGKLAAELENNPGWTSVYQELVLEAGDRNRDDDPRHSAKAIEAATPGVSVSARSNRVTPAPMSASGRGSGKPSFVRTADDDHSDDDRDGEQSGSESESSGSDGDYDPLTAHGELAMVRKASRWDRIEREDGVKLRVKRWKEEGTVQGVTHRAGQMLRTWEVVRESGIHSYSMSSNPEYRDALEAMGEEMLKLVARHVEHEAAQERRRAGGDSDAGKQTGGDDVTPGTPANSPRAGGGVREGGSSVTSQEQREIDEINQWLAGAGGGGGETEAEPEAGAADDDSGAAAAAAATVAGDSEVTHVVVGVQDTVTAHAAAGTLGYSGVGDMSEVADALGEVPLDAYGSAAHMRYEAAADADDVLGDAGAHDMEAGAYGDAHVEGYLEPPAEGFA